MSKDEIDKVDKQLSIREKLTIHILLFLVEVIKPFSWSHDTDTFMETFKEDLKKG